MALFKQINSIKLDPRLERLPLYKLIITVFIVNIIIIIIGLISKLILPPQIPLFFGLPQTEEQLAPSLLIIIPPSLSLILTLVNTILAINIENLYIKKSLVFASVAITLLSTIAVIKIILLVGSL